MMQTKRPVTMLASVALAAALGAPLAATADDDDRGGNNKATLLGANENPLVITDADGRFRANVRRNRVDFRLRFQGLDSGVQQAHIHVANPWDNGPIAVWLCTNIMNTPPGATDRACPDPGGTVRGSIVADDVQAAGPLAAGDLDSLVKLMSQGALYVNVHSDKVPSGELRGQINARRR